jgi:hypothetical protein
MPADVGSSASTWMAARAQLTFLWPLVKIAKDSSHDFIQITKKVTINISILIQSVLYVGCSYEKIFVPRPWARDKQVLTAWTFMTFCEHVQYKLMKSHFAKCKPIDKRIRWIRTRCCLFTQIMLLRWVSTNLIPPPRNILPCDARQAARASCLPVNNNGGNLKLSKNIPFYWKV